MPQNANTYIAVLDIAPDGTYGVRFPDILGCTSAGDTLETAIANAREALGLHLAGMREDGEPIPEPRTIDEIVGDPENTEGTVALTPVSPKGPVRKAVRINLTIDPDLLDEIDGRAEALGLSRAAFLANAARNQLTDGGPP